MSDIKNLVIDRWFLDLYNYSVRYHEGDESAHAKILAIQDEIRSLILKAEDKDSEIKIGDKVRLPGDSEFRTVNNVTETLLDCSKDLIVTQGQGITIKEAWEEPSVIWNWKTMETAPKKDEEMILVWDGDYWCPMPVFFESTDDVWMLFGHKEILTPIAWMPLPDPPRFDN